MKKKILFTIWLLLLSGNITIKTQKNIFLKKSLCDNLNNLSNKRDKDLIYKYRISNSYVKSKAKFLKRKKKLYLNKFLKSSIIIIRQNIIRSTGV